MGLTPLYLLARSTLIRHAYGPPISAEQHYIDLMRVLEERGAKGDVIVAMLLRDEPLTDRLLSADPTSAVRRGQGGCTPLYVAAWKGDKNLAQRLLGLGADPRGPNLDGATPLHAAALSESADIAELLLARGADVNAKDASGRTPLHLAVWSEDSICVSRRTYTGDPPRPLHDSRPFIALLLAHGAAINAKDAQGQTPLHYAAANCPNEVLAALLQAGAAPNVQDEGGLTPLHMLVTSDWYMEPDATIKAVEAFLEEASDARRAEGVRLLTAAGADPTVPSGGGYTALYFAGLSGDDARTIAALFAAGGDKQPRLPLVVPAVLKQGVLLSFERTPLSDAALFLSHVSGMEVEWEASEARRQVTVRFDGPLWEGLNALCQQAGLVWTFSDDTIRITAYRQARERVLAPQPQPNRQR